MHKLSYKTLFLIIVLLLIPIVFLLKSKKVTIISAAWWNESWSYRQPISINTHSVGETNVYITYSVNIGSTAKAQTDDGDFRFINAAGELLSYYIVSNAGTTNPTFHILIPNYPAGTQTFYVYYGNPSAPNGFSSSDFATAASFTIATSTGEEVGGGPIAWWKFDEGVGTTIYDSSPNLNMQVFAAGNSSPTWASEDQCISGKCLLFDNIDYIQSSNTTAGNFDTDNFTIQTWIRTGVSASFKNLIYKGAGNGKNGWRFGLLNGVPDMLIGDTNSFVENAFGSTSIADNKWHFMAIVFNRASTAEAFVDGQSVGTVNISAISSSVNNSSKIFIGLPFAAFTGFLDDIKLYPYSRSSSQIKNDYISGLSGQSANQGSNSSFGASTQKSLSDGLIGYWKFDENVGTTTADSSGNNLTLTFGTGSSAPSWNGAKFGVGLSFNGSTTYVQSTSTILEINNNITMSAWIKPGGTPAADVVIMSKTNNNFGYQLGWNSAMKPKLRIGNGTAYTDTTGNTTLAIGTWYYISATANSTGSVKIYIDGVLDISNSSGILSAAVGQNFRIGTRSTGNEINALIDEVRIYNRSLTPEEINALYHYSPGPIAWWKLDEPSWTNDCSTATILDYSGNNYNGKSCPNTTGPLGGSNGKFGNAGLFDYTNDFLSLPAVSFAPGGGTISAWVNMTTIPAVSSYYSVVMRNYQEDGIDIQNDTVNGHVVVYFRAGGASCSSQYSASHYLTAGNWYHLTGTYDGQNMRLYINGQLENTCATAGDWGDNTATWGISSMHGTDPSNRFNGKIDDVRLYNYVRNPEQIVQDMQGGNSTNPGLGKPIVYYKLDEGQGSVTNNSGYGGSLYSGTFGSGSSSPTWALGTNNKSLSFDGSNDYVTSGLDLDNSKPWTYSFWTKVNASVDGADEMINGGNHNPRVAFYTNKVQVSYKNTAGSYFDGVISGPVTTLGNWYHYSLTWDESKLILYQNGNEVGRYTVTDGMYNDSSNIILGYRFGNPINGYIDDFKVYAYALSPDEIKSDYNAGSSTKIGQSTQTIGATTTLLDYCLPGDTTSCNPPVGVWNFEEGIGTTVYDSSGNNNFGVFSASAPVWTPGKTGEGLTFDSNNAQLTISPSASLNNLPASGMSVSAWIYPRSRGENNVAFIVAKNNGFNPTSGWYFRLASTYALNFSVDGSTDLVRITSDNVVVPNRWNHVEVSWDGVITTAASVHIYVNGNEVSYVTTTNGAARVDDSASNFYIGNDSGQVRTFDGIIDQVRAYNYVRTLAQVAYDYNKGYPIRWWKLNECQGTIANDSSGLGFTGSISIGPSGSQNSLGTCAVGVSAAWTTGANGKYNGSLNFDGNDDNVSLGANSLGNLGGIFSISAWVKTSSPSTQIMFSEFEGGVCGDGYFRMGSGILRFGDGASATIDGVKAINDGSWHMATFVSRSGNAEIYVDGKLDKTGTDVNWQNTCTTQDVKIGSYSTGLSPFTGQIDDLRVYRYDLTPSQVLTLYNNGAAAFN